jgi:hypothetical protein
MTYKHLLSLKRIQNQANTTATMQQKFVKAIAIKFTLVGKNK